MSHPTLTDTAWMLLQDVSDRFHGGGSFSPEVAKIDLLLRQKALADGKTPAAPRSVRARSAYDGSCREGK